MIEGSGFLLVLSVAMFVGSYVAGSIPLLVNLSESKIRTASIFGAGLLIGTALSVIIPEGIEALYSLDHVQQHHEEIPGAIVNPAEAKRLLEEAKPKENLDDLPHLVPKNAKINDVIQRSARSLESNFTRRTKREADSSHHEKDEEHHEHSHPSNIHAKIGYSLVFGFLLMLVVDQISSAAISNNDRNGRHRIGVSATIGLVVHAAADGVALGSASVINKSDVQLIVFVAIMLHKAPAAFGLVSFLLMEGIDKRNIRKHLMIFSSAAPIAGLITFVLIAHSGIESTNSSHTGVLMLFSAGTFLYVSTVHVIPELASQKSNEYSLVVDAQAPSSIGGHSHAGGNNFTLRETLLIIGGAVVPAILASGHSH